MADYDSDSSAGEDVETNVLLGYASKEPTVDDFSQLGGHPTWLDETTTPPGILAKCKVCNGLMSLLLQINGDLPGRFPGHERRLYVWACKRKACRRKEGSVRGFRGSRQMRVQQSAKTVEELEENEKQSTSGAVQNATNLGETLFGVKPSASGQANPFASPTSNGGSSNPFAAGGSQSNPFATASSLAAKPAQKPDETDGLPQTFAQKARISTPAPTLDATLASPAPPTTSETWPEQSAFPETYPRYHLDADKEYIDPEANQPPSNVRVDSNAMDTGEGSSGGADIKDAFESSMDKTFQRFADRLAQNPEQVLRYEFGAQPLLYSKTDGVGKILGPAQENANAKVKTAGGTGGSKMPRCTNCGAERVFELQLTPHLITELEAEEMSIDGMDWGTVILGVCSKDCQQGGKGDGEVGYVEEWTGVQWEELASNKRPA